MKIILGSTSPRRRDLLQSLRLPFEVIAPQQEEQRRPGEDVMDYVRRNGREKAASVLEVFQQRPDRADPVCIISADTVVLLDDQLLEKPRDEADACRMLAGLSGRLHRVATAVTLLVSGRKGEPHLESFTCTTEVLLKDLNEEEIRAYVGTGEPLDKAGSYAIQGLGGYMVSRIQGSWSNVVGLPLAELCDALRAVTGLEVPGKEPVSL